MTPREDSARHLEGSLRHALAELHPAELVRPELPAAAPALVVAVGKAALPMLSAARSAFPEAPWIAVPPAGQGAEEAAAEQGARGVVSPGAHPLPDERSVRAAELVLGRVARLRADDTLLLLLSGGGSSLLCAPEGVDLEQKRAVVDELMRAGADIFELNAVRKHLSRVKGGRLAAATEARIVGLVISDVPGDDLAVVASGVAAPDDTTYADALAVLDRFGVTAPAVRAHLQRGVAGEIAENPKADDPLWGQVESRVVGSNGLLLEEARRYWEANGYRAVVLSDRLVGEAREVAQLHADIVLHLRAGGQLAELPRRFPDAGLQQGGVPLPADGVRGGEAAPLVLLSGGETTVTVKGSGRGGRNQEFALWLLKHLHEGAQREGWGGVWAISAGSDGVDGNSDAAGAILRPDSWERARSLGLDVDDHLRRNDSHTFFAALGDAVVTGPTGNNLNDYRAIVL